MHAENDLSTQAVSKEHLAYLQTRKISLPCYGSPDYFVSWFYCLVEAAAVRWIDPFIMSQPSRIVQTLHSLYAAGDLTHEYYWQKR